MGHRVMGWVLTFQISTIWEMMILGFQLVMRFIPCFQFCLALSLHKCYIFKHYFYAAVLLKRSSFLKKTLFEVTDWTKMNINHESFYLLNTKKALFVGKTSKFEYDTTLQSHFNRIGIRIKYCKMLSQSIERVHYIVQGCSRQANTSPEWTHFSFMLLVLTKSIHRWR